MYDDSTQSIAGSQLRAPARTWPLLAVAFGALVVLTSSFTAAIERKVEHLQRSLLDLSANYESAHDRLDSIRTNIYVTSLLVRDYLSSDVSDPSVLQSRISTYRTASLRNLQGLHVSSPLSREARLKSFESELAAFWSSIEPIFGWTAGQRSALRSEFLSQNVMPRRAAVIALAEEIGDLNASTLKAERQDVTQALSHFDAHLNRLAVLTLMLMFGVAIASLCRIYQLEGRSRSEYRRTQEAELSLRRLSHELVNAQERERRSLSRELHDQLGQMLTSAKVCLRNAVHDRSRDDSEFKRAVDECHSMLDSCIQSVRDLAMGLRPSMLDDLGLGPALDWQAREFSRRYDTPVIVDLQDDIDEGLSDAERTAMYRIVQEALTNCARHAKATSVRIRLSRTGGMLSLIVEDDGVGIHNVPRKGGSFGLLGIQERVRELGGAFSVSSKETGGTALVVDVPAVSSVGA